MIHEVQVGHQLWRERQAVRSQDIRLENQRWTKKVHLSSETIRDWVGEPAEVYTCPPGTKTLLPGAPDLSRFQQSAGSRGSHSHHCLVTTSASIGSSLKLGQSRLPLLVQFQSLQSKQVLQTQLFSWWANLVFLGLSHQTARFFTEAVPMVATRDTTAPSTAGAPRVKSDRVIVTACGGADTIPTQVGSGAESRQHCGSSSGKQCLASNRWMVVMWELLYNWCKKLQDVTSWWFGKYWYSMVLVSFYFGRWWCLDSLCKRGITRRWRCAPGCSMAMNYPELFRTSGMRARMKKVWLGLRASKGHGDKGLWFLSFPVSIRREQTVPDKRQRCEDSKIQKLLMQKREFHMWFSMVFSTCFSYLFLRCLRSIPTEHSLKSKSWWVACWWSLGVSTADWVPLCLVMSGDLHTTRSTVLLPSAWWTAHHRQWEIDKPLIFEG